MHALLECEVPYVLVTARWLIASVADGWVIPTRLGAVVDLGYSRICIGYEDGGFVLLHVLPWYVSMLGWSKVASVGGPWWCSLFWLFCEFVLMFGVVTWGVVLAYVPYFGVIFCYSGFLMVWFLFYVVGFVPSNHLYFEAPCFAIQWRMDVAGRN